VSQFGQHVPEVASACFQPCIDSVVPGVLIGGCLFDSRLHGRSNAAFHSRCDGKGATIGFVFSGSSVFGFVATQSWNVRTDLGGTSAGIEAPGCRLFSVFRDGVFDPMVFELADKGDRSAMLCSPRIGPGFGSTVFSFRLSLVLLFDTLLQHPTFASTSIVNRRNQAAAP
jgi:hypothetical protein